MHSIILSENGLHNSRDQYQVRGKTQGTNVYAIVMAHAIAEYTPQLALDTLTMNATR